MGQRHSAILFILFDLAPQVLLQVTTCIQSQILLKLLNRFFMHRIVICTSNTIIRMHSNNDLRGATVTIDPCFYEFDTVSINIVEFVSAHPMNEMFRPCKG